MARDFYVEAAAQRANMIEAELASAKADLAAYKANNDVESAGSTVQQIANLTAEQQNLSNLYSAYVQSQQPPAPIPQTAEELRVKSWDKMTYDDALQLAKTSKYGRDLNWNDPNVIAGYREAQRRRSRGE
jgi:hypothetical protein